MVSFQDFAEMLERNLIFSWRSALGRDSEDLEMINSTVFTMDEEKGKWNFSFGLRKHSKWNQVRRSIDPIEYDILDPPPAGQFDEKSMSPENRASQLAMEMLTEIKEEVSKWA